MSANDGGEPVRLSRTPVPKPVIPRGQLTVPAASVISGDGDIASFYIEHDGFWLTYFNIPIEAVGLDCIQVNVAPTNVVHFEKR